ncbi:MAG: hypothetical protein EA400_09735 [Chromatiaceae bacterium]|nr:MAG: hypothetical protein EA400_09735 [Chromatiaceae bacterium]
MDHELFRQTVKAIDERYCPFEKAILTNNCDCSRAQRFCIAERDGLHCGDSAAQARCVELLARLRGQARFALRTPNEHAALPHAKAMRVQVGGLRGLHAALHPQQSAPRRIADIDHLVRAALAQFGSLANLPFGVLIQQIAAYRGRRPLRTRN